MATIVALYLSGSLASMVWPVLVVMVEVVMLALVELLTLTAAFAFVEVLVSVACWQAEAAKANATAAINPFDPFRRRMKIFSSLRGRDGLDEKFLGTV